MTQKLLGEIYLTKDEKTFFKAIEEYLRLNSLDTTVRVAGGWVRDKLLNLKTKDIDLAVDNLSGAEFAKGLVAYLNALQENTGKKEKLVSGFGVIKENPAQSKHLQTATFVFNSLEIDVNALRAESYTADSRIPNVVFAFTTDLPKSDFPKKDAERRDFTVNALFYNLWTHKLEDFCGGLSDLTAAVLRTPVCAAQTFAEDPLRVLRAVRFSVCLGLVLDPSVAVAAKLPEIRTALAEKISRERFGLELKKTLQYKPCVLVQKNTSMFVKVTSHVEKVSLFSLATLFFGKIEELGLSSIVLFPRLHYKEGDLGSHNELFKTANARLVRLHAFYQTHSVQVGAVCTEFLKELRWTSVFSVYVRPLLSLASANKKSESGGMVARRLVMAAFKLSSQEATEIEQVVDSAANLENTSDEVSVCKELAKLGSRQKLVETVLVLLDAKLLAFVLDLLENKPAEAAANHPILLRGNELRAALGIKDNRLIGRSMGLQKEWIYGKVLSGETDLTTCKEEMKTYVRERLYTS